MNSPILESLPAIHVTIVGVVAAFFAAFAVFAFQKVQESKDKLENVLKGVEAFGSPNNFHAFSQVKLLTDDGLLDWNGAAHDTLYEAESLFSHLDIQSKYGYKPSFIREPSNEEIYRVGGNLLLLMNYVFTTYPFNGRSMVSISGEAEKVEEQKNRPFDVERLSQMTNRISYLSQHWRNHSKSILELANRLTMHQEEMEHERREKAYQKAISQLPENVHQQQIDTLRECHFDQPLPPTNYVQIVSDFFNKVMQYESEVLPVLAGVITEHRRYNERFMVKKWSLVVIKLIVFTLTFGVCLPLVLLEMLHGIEHFNWDSLWVGWLEYFVLFLTMSPYFVLCRYFYCKLQKIPFD
ncbi:hypothetical protein ACTA57_002903 [Vibrio parahaemolyticus]|nr:hypothetical protein [Vibrio parahaemolyticus]